MATIVKNNEVSDQKTRRGDSEPQRYPIGNVEREVHHAQQREVRDDRIRDLP